MQAHTFDCFSEDLGLGRHNFAGHSFALMLTPHQPTGDCAITEELRSVGPGFPAKVTWARSGAKAALAADTVMLRAEDSALGPFSYGALVNTSSGRVVAWFATGEHTLKQGESMEIRFPSVILSVGGAAAIGISV